MLEQIVPNCKPVQVNTMTRFTLQDVLLRMITRPLNGVSGVYYKIRWEQDAGLWALTRARLPRDHDKTTPYRAEEGSESPSFS